VRSTIARFEAFCLVLCIVLLELRESFVLERPLTPGDGFLSSFFAGGWILGG